jgi:hypothetical protein
MGTVSLPRGYNGGSVALSTHTNLAPSLKQEYSYTSNLSIVLHGLLQDAIYLYYSCFLHGSTLHFSLSLAAILVFLFSFYFTVIAFLSDINDVNRLTYKTQIFWLGSLQSISHDSQFARPFLLPFYCHVICLYSDAL